MPGLCFTRAAEDDLLAIWVYIAGEDQNAATAVLRDIHTKCLFLAAHPKAGPARPDIAPQLRYGLAGRYLVLYREIEGGIEVVRVLHGARDLRALFS